jgi:asparagine synthase (glutamine-hydrolysing)
MCGIAGIFEYRRCRRVEPGVIRAMTDVIRHRGPDDSGELLGHHLGLGMRRLSIIDLEGSHQPVSNGSGQVTVVFNGEIYNFCELRKNLAADGHTFRTQGDTEVIVHQYEKDGEACVEALRGMFAFALWDTAAQKLMLARDRLGIKPLYYVDTGEALIFASEIKSILKYPGLHPELDPQALSDFLSLKYVPSPQTLFRNIYSLPPGCLLICDRSGVHTRPYWDLSFAPQSGGSEAERAEQLESLLRESVRLHLQSDVPFGAFLSGGLDSSTIVAIMSSYLDQPVETFSIGFSGEGSALSEAKYARRVAEHFGTRHNEITIGASDFVGRVERVIWHLDQPVADLACFANMMLAEAASQTVKMVLTGEGGDELFAGYARYSGERLSPFTTRLPAFLKSWTLQAAEQAFPGRRRARLALRALLEKDDSKRLLDWFPLFNAEEKSRLVLPNGPLGECAATERVIAAQLGQFCSRSALHRMLYLDTKLWLPDDLLARGDKMSMAASIEARVPLLDHKVVEFAASLPPGLKIRGLTRKYLLKKVAGKLLPTEIVHRKKQGFPIPISTWFRNEAREFIADILSPEAIRRRGLFDPAYAQRLLAEHLSGRADRGAQLWSLALVELWLQQFIDSPAAREHLPAPRASALSEAPALL